jgi:hypothetical protein
LRPHHIAQTPVRCQYGPAVVVGNLNRALHGWANYFQAAIATHACRALNNDTAPRLRR